MSSPQSFLDFSPSEWAGMLAAKGELPFRANQVVQWIFKQLVLSPDQMSNIAKSLRDELSNSVSWQMPEVTDTLHAPDGSTKLLFKTHNGQYMESVILRYEGRVSLCVSSQVGCKLACSFCQTGKLGFFRHLSTHEILAQYVFASRLIRAEGRRISHVVFMGMGEPLDNYDAVVKAVNALVSPEGFGLSARHVTISTSGIVPRIKTLPADVRGALAVSLHAARDELRSELMPINRKYPLNELKGALLEYQKLTGDKVTIEYILIKGVNCGLREAKELVRFLHGLRAKVNLIPFNAHPGLPYDRPDDDEIRTFQKYLAERSIPAPVRYSKGLEVSAACGQLAAKHREILHVKPLRPFAVGKQTPCG